MRFARKHYRTDNAVFFAYGDINFAQLVRMLKRATEGMAVGVAYAGALMGSGITSAGALALALGIAIQNFPEDQRRF